MATLQIYTWTIYLPDRPDLYDNYNQNEFTSNSISCKLNDGFIFNFFFLNKTTVEYSYREKTKKYANYPSILPIRLFEENANGFNVLLKNLDLRLVQLDTFKLKFPFDLFPIDFGSTH